MASEDQELTQQFEQFVAQWNFDQKSQEVLAGLPVAVLKRVMEEFAPPAGTKNVNAMLATFVKSVAKSWASQAVSNSGEKENAIQEFKQTWAIDEGSETLLRSLSANVLEYVLANFAPEADTRNVNAKLATFVRTKTGGAPSAANIPSAGYAVSAEGAAGPEYEEQIQEFVNRWSVDSKNESDLRALTAEQLEAVLRDFEPPPGTFNPNGKLSGFMKCIINRTGGSAAPALINPRQLITRDSGRGSHRIDLEPEIRSFVERWSVDSRNESDLRLMTDDQIMAVLRDFEPPPGTHNVNGKLSGFMRSVSARSIGSHHDSAPKAPRLDLEREIRSFVERWSVDSRNESDLRLMTDDQIMAVLRDFEPPPGTHNVNGKLSGFMRSVATRSAGSHYDSAPKAPRVDLEREIRSFVERWSVDSRNESDLRLMSDDQIMAVLRDFEPPPGTHNVNGKLNGFMRSVATRSVGSSTGTALDTRRFAEEHGIDADALNLLNTLPAATQRAVLADFRPPANCNNPSANLRSFIKLLQNKADVGKGGGGGRGRSDGRHGDRISRFVADWGLDETSEGLVRGLSEDMQEKVLQEFRPPPGTRNPNGKLATWLKGMAGSQSHYDSQNGGDAKRRRTSY